MIQHLTEIVEEARKRGRKRLAVAYGQDSHTLEAVYEAYKEGLVEPTLYGDKKVIEEVCQTSGLDLKAFNIVDESNDVKCVQQAVAAVVAGNADVLMKGLVSTDKYMRGILNKEAGLFPPKGVLSHVSIVEMPCYHKLLVISDVAVIPLPDFKQKTVQIGYLARTANLLGITTPKIACIAPSEQLLPNVISSTEGALLAKMADRGQLGNVIVDGPLSLDVALYKEVAEHKKVKGSSVAGDPDCLLFPNLESANVFFKSVSHLCGGHGHGYEGSVRAHLARRHEQDETLLDRAGLPRGEIALPGRPDPHLPATFKLLNLKQPTTNREIYGIQSIGNKSRLYFHKGRPL